MPATLGGHYTLEEEIGRGGMAVVFRAHDVRHHRTVAIKILDRELAASIGSDRFLREIATVAGLSHPNIVPVYDSGEQKGIVYYVMPHIAGNTLRQSIDAVKRLSLAEVVHITARVAAALDFAHRHGVVHRDIKPENIVLFEGEPLILDFGISKAITAAGGPKLTQTGLAVGTPAYLSPEQASGETNLDGASDQYSLACVVYEMVAGTPPFTGVSPQSVIARRFVERARNLSEVVSGIPRVFADAVARALSLEATDRFSTVTAFANALAAGTNTFASEESTASRIKKPSVAVLPFANSSSDADNEFFADGITEEIINALTRVRALSVVSRTASFALKGQTEGLDEVARKLRVSNILEGSVRKSNNQLRVTVQLVAVSSGNTIWSDRYDRGLADVFTIQEEIATSIVNALEVVLSGDEEAAIRKVHTRSVRAYEYYLRGRQLYHMRRTEALAGAEEMYHRAIALDSRYALAYAGLADSAAVRYGSFGGGEKALAQAEEASRRALGLDPMLAEAHAAHGLVLSYQSRFDEADREFREAVRLDPTSYDAFYHYGRMLVAAGRTSQASEAFENAASLRPDDYQAIHFMATIREGDAQPAEWLTLIGRVMEAVERALMVNPADSRALIFGATTLQRMGDADGAREWLERAIRLDATNPMTIYNTACFEARAGRTQAALDHLQHAIDLGFHHANWLLHDPDVASIRDHPRFQLLLRELQEGH